VELIAISLYFTTSRSFRTWTRVAQVIGDPGQLQQVFTNLLLNAADAMSGHGKFSITSRPAAGGTA